METLRRSHACPGPWLHLRVSKSALTYPYFILIQILSLSTLLHLGSGSKSGGDFRISIASSVDIVLQDLGARVDVSGGLLCMHACVTVLVIVVLLGKCSFPGHFTIRYSRCFVLQCFVVVAILYRS